MIGMCGHCYSENVELFPANCEEKPEEKTGGMHHCSDCEAMVVAGVSHFPLCKKCIDRRHPEFD